MPMLDAYIPEGALPSRSKAARCRPSSACPAARMAGMQPGQ
jgi:hypothetical protein